MKTNRFYYAIAMLAVFSMLIAACTPAVTTTVEPVVTQPPAAVATTAPTEAAAATPTTAATEAATTAPTVAAEEETFWTPELKQAFAAAIDREAIVDRVFEGRNIPAYHQVPPGYPYATEPFLDKYGQRDLDMAIDLLEKAGYTEAAPFTFDLWYPPEHYGTTTADVMQVIKEQLEETGRIKINLQSQNWAEYVDSFVAGEAFPVFILGWFPDFVDPENWLTPFASCLASPDNGIFYCNEEMDALLLKAASSADPVEREALYQQIGELYAEEVPTLPLFWEPEFISSRTGVEGIAIGSSFEFNYFPLKFGTGATPASGDAKTIIIGTTDAVNSLDPQDAYATHDWEILKNTNNALMSYAPGTADLVPGAAEAAPEISEDGLTYTFTLREGLKFADGTLVTSADYVRSWKRLNDLEGQVSGLIQSYVADVEAVDETTVAYTLSAPFAFFPALAATPPFIPTNPKQYTDTEINAFPEAIDGIGPYRMVSHAPGEQMVLEANENYVGDNPAIIQKVIIRYFADATTMAQAVERGEIDIAWRTVGPVEANRLKDIEGLTVETINAPALRYLAFNHNYKGTR